MSLNYFAAKSVRLDVLTLIRCERQGGSLPLWYSNARVEKGAAASLAGAVCNNELLGDEINADAHLLLATHITYRYSDGLQVYISKVHLQFIRMMIYTCIDVLKY
ncbi:hypothetical protein Sjap_012252 [Stephania japonica]|uniref:Uncharacterized protein n=1 Tax=Stephania japonica TaxID=461633 RepID=A0AAP0NYQ5_9MAGN